MGLLKNILPESVYRKILQLKYDWYGQPTTSYSQEGEDLILNKAFYRKHDGFYLDIGAHHPKRFSNTYLLYKKGWRGINIEPNPDQIKKFISQRNRDINLGIGISRTAGVLKYYSFYEPALNTFSEEVCQERIALNYKLKEVIEVQTLPLSQVLDQYLPKGTTIDFMNIDVEGFDMQVLESNNWDKYQPSMIMIEEIHSDKTDFMDLPSYQFLKPYGYNFFAKTFNTLVYTKGRLQ